MSSTAGVVVRFVENGDIIIDISAVNQDDAATFAIDLAEREIANDDDYKRLRKLSIARIHSTTSGTGTTHNPQLVNSDGFVQFVADDDAGLDVDVTYSEAFPAYFPDGILTFNPQIDAGSDNTLSTQIFLSAAPKGWRP